MKRMMKRVNALVMAVIVTMTMIMPTNVYATQLEQENVLQDLTVSANTSVSDNEILSENTLSEVELDEFGEEGKLNYLYLENNYIETPEKGYVLISFGDEETEIKEATLVVNNYRTEEKRYFSNEESFGNLVSFSLDFSAEDQGLYEAVALSVTTLEGKTKYVPFEKTGMERVYFGVNEEVVRAEESLESVNPVVETQIVTFEDEQAQGITEKQITDAVEEALENAEENVEDETLDVTVPLAAIGVDAQRANGNYVVVLDPGHDSTHAGAQYGSLKEEDITLKIAQYCKAELEKYAGITVYMTRTTSACPNPSSGSGIGSSTVDNRMRVEYAASVGADIYVSFHLNADASGNGKGAEVYYPNSNYNPTIGTQGANLAKEIQRQLTALGLYNRGIKIWNSQDNTLYPDGSLADYLGVIKNSKLHGFPAVLIEHAFMSNSGDAAFLSQEANLRNLGIADANGIVNYLGLAEKIEIKSNLPVITAADNEKGTVTVQVTGVNPLASTSEVRFAVWSDANGQDDLVWYTAEHLGNGTFSKTIQAKENGKYQIHTYAYDTRGNAHGLGTNTCTFSVSRPVASDLTAVLSADERYVTLTASGVEHASALSFAVWSNVNGQDDLVWYTPTNVGNNTWKVTVPISNHRYSTGTYSVHVYGHNYVYSNIAVKTGSFYINGPDAGVISFQDISEEDGRFTVKLTGAKSSAGIRVAQVAVWSAVGGQDDLVWYTATYKADGSFVVPVDMANHKYTYGTYYAHAYVTDNNSVTVVTAGDVVLNQPKAAITTTLNGSQTQANIKAVGVALPGGVKGVQMAVWSNTGGQDDLVWYQASQRGSTWSVNVPVYNHATAGTYSVHVYATDANGGSHVLGTSQFAVEGPSSGSVSFKNKDEEMGYFTASVDGVTAKAGIRDMQVAVWSEIGGQDDLIWYTATYNPAKRSFEVPVDMANHKFTYGTYHVHAYAIDNNGVQSVSAGSVVMNQPQASIAATMNGNHTQANVKAVGVALPGGVRGVQIAVWSNAGGQDDLVWYQASHRGGSTWNVNVPIYNHATAGTYSVHVYATDANGGSHVLGTSQFTVEGPRSGSVSFKNKDEEMGYFTASVDGITAKAGIRGMQVAVWSEIGGQDDLIWYTATYNPAKRSFEVPVDMANHKFTYGTYHVHAYAIDNNGVQSVSAGSVVMNQPQASIAATMNGNHTQANVKAVGVALPGGVRGVQIAVWSNAGGQDDLVWYQASHRGGSTWNVNVPIYNHATAGTYSVHVYAIDGNGGSHVLGASQFTVEGPNAKQAVIVSERECDGVFTAEIQGVSAKAGIRYVQAAVWCAEDQSDLLWYNTTDMHNGNFQVGVDVRNHNLNRGTYKIHFYAVDNNGVQVGLYATTCKMEEISNLLYPVMGSTSVTVDQMVAYYNSVTTYPTFYATTDAPTLRQFCQIYIEECAAEGVKAEVAFVQAMKETNFLRYGGDVKIQQFNFAGIGATGGGAPGNSFASVRIGIRAQVQHLKAYASDQPLNQACVDPRFQYINPRNTAPYCEWLGQHENPYGKGWATAVRYGYNIVERITNLKRY